MKATMIVAALLSTVSALPAANSTEATEVASISPEVQELAAKTIASIKLVESGNATPEQVATAVKENLNQFESYISGLSGSNNRVDSSSMWPAFNDFAKGFNFEAGKAGIGGGKGGWGGMGGGHGWGKCTPRADDVDDMDNDLDGDCDDDDSLLGVVGLLLEAVAETLDQLIPGLDDVVEELTDDLSTNDKNYKKVHNPDNIVKGKGQNQGGKAPGGGGKPGSW